jgi:sec-independent protein translocase protein TatB
MFDIGFSELMVIAVVALIVIGPERLPKVARTLGHLFGRMQRYVNDVKADIAREMELDELKKLQAQMQDAARTFEQSVNREINATETELQKIAQEANPTPIPPPSPETVAASAEATTSPAVPEHIAPTTHTDIAPVSSTDTLPAVSPHSEPVAGASQPSNTRA